VAQAVGEDAGVAVQARLEQERILERRRVARLVIPAQAVEHVVDEDDVVVALRLPRRRQSSV
jgi:hypothetical protein